MKGLAIAGEAFDGCQLVAFSLHREHQAGPHWRAVEQHRAAAAHAMLATDVCPGQAEVVPEVVGEQPARIFRRRVRDAIDPHAAKALSVSTLTRWIRNSGVASMSPLGSRSLAGSRGSAS